MANDGIQTSIDPEGAFKRAASGTTLPSVGPGLTNPTSRVGYDLITDGAGNRYIVALDQQTNQVSVYRVDDKGGFKKVEVEDHMWERVGSPPAHGITLADGTNITTGNASTGPTINGKPAEIGTRGTMMGGAPTGIVLTPQIAGEILSGAEQIEPLVIKHAPKFDIAALPS